MKENHVSIWFIIGLQLAIIGVIVVAATLYGMVVPPEHPILFDNLHPGLFEGIILIALGGLYIVKFRPGRLTQSQPPITP